MKNILIKSLSIVLAAFVAAGCVKETFPAGGTLTTGQVESNEMSLDYMLNGIPAAMMTSGTAGYASTYGYHADFGIPAIHLMTEAMLEDLTVSGELGYWWFGAFTQNLSQGADYIYCAYFWDCYYAWIKLVNDIIIKVGEVTPETDKATLNLLGQAYAYRAMFYLDLARLYEPKDNSLVPIAPEIAGLTVPVITENTTEADAFENPRATREDMYDFILSDLETAKDYLDASDKTYTRPTLAAVYGLMARAYVELGAPNDNTRNKEAYKNAARYAELAISTSGKTPLTSAQWHDPKSGFNDGSANNSWIWGLSLSVENASNIISNISHIASEAVWGYSILSLPSVNKALYDRMDINDFRRKSFLDPDYTWDHMLDRGGKYTENHGYKFAGSTDANDYFVYYATPYVNIKFRPADGECIDYTVGNCADHVLMRVEEMYFVRIEAALYADGLDAAKKLLNEFVQTYRYRSYDCSGINSIEAFISEMLFQKRVEFWGEGILFYDYKRLNQGITRGYSGTNFPAVARFNTEGRSPQWNVVITRTEYQSNRGIDQSLNNPDPTQKLPLWTE